MTRSPGLRVPPVGVIATNPLAERPGVTVTERRDRSAPCTWTREVPSAATERALTGTASTAPSVLWTAIVRITEAPTSDAGASLGVISTENLVGSTPLVPGWVASWLVLNMYAAT